MASFDDRQSIHRESTHNVDLKLIKLGGMAVTPSGDTDTVGE